VGIKTQAFFLFGVPGETPETIRETIDFAQELNASSSQFAVAIPHPGTALYEECKANGWLTSENWADYTAEVCVVETPWLPARKVEEARIQAYRKYYYRVRFIFGEALRVRRLADLKRLARGANSVRSRIRFFRQVHQVHHGADRNGDSSSEERRKQMTPAGGK
jgi:radical SAM superfamily enzyme YgiQ (UPF0313 family)